MGRPKLAQDALKVKETIYLLPDVHKWLADKAPKRDASISSYLNVLCKEKMLKESK
jgi:hypothetical protein